MTGSMSAALPRFCVAMTAVALIAACSTSPALADGDRVMVKTDPPGLDPTAIAVLAGDAAGVAAEYVAAAGGGWHALRLRCADAAACERAHDRLVRSATAGRGPIEAVASDRRKRAS